MDMSLLNLTSHEFLDGVIPLKCKLFLSFQTLQAAMVKVSMNSGLFQEFLPACSNESLQSRSGQDIPMMFQQSTTNGHLKNKCATVYSGGLGHSKQLYFLSTST